MIRFMAEWALRSSILILAGALLLRALRVKDPFIRLAAWTTMLCGSLAIPALTSALPTMPLTVKLETVGFQPAEAVYEVAPSKTPAFSRHDAVVLRRRAGGFSFDWLKAGMVVYVLIGGALLLRLCVGLTRSLRLLHFSRTTGQMTEGIDIRESTGVSSPAALGIARPAIVLPADWRQWDGGKLNAVLAHERSHIQRHDPAWQLLSAIHRALLWHTPMSWLLHRHIVRVAEEASDDAAVAASGDRVFYAEILIDFMQRGVPDATGQGVPMARYGNPAARIHRILDATSLSHGITKWSLTAILALGSPLAYLVAAAQPWHPPQRLVETPAPVSESTATASAPPAVAADQTPAPQRTRLPAAVPLEQPLSFDAASVKPTSQTPRDIRATVGTLEPIGGPGTKDPGRFRYPLVTLKSLIILAYDAQNFQIVGPSWLDTYQFFTLEATMPPSTTKEQFRAMLRNLLADRFKLTVHRETKEVPGYALVVGKNGPKMKESAEVPVPEADDAIAPRLELGADGYFVPPPRAGIFFQLTNHRGEGIGARATFRQVTMQALTHNLEGHLMRPVADATGLTAKYDFILSFSMEGLDVNRGLGPVLVSARAEETLPNLPSALQEQLGLKLESKKELADVVVIDHAEKMPTEN